MGPRDPPGPSRRGVVLSSSIWKTSQVKLAFSFVSAKPKAAWEAFQKASKCWGREGVIVSFKGSSGPSLQLFSVHLLLVHLDHGRVGYACYLTIELAS